MDVSISDNGRLGKLQGNINKAIRAGLARATAAQELSIKVRSDRGFGLKGWFKPYSPSYAAFRSEKGRQTSPVNHHFTGRMLASIQWRADSKKGKIFFSSSAEKKKAARTHAIRPWWGITKKERGFIGKQFNEGFRAAL